MRERIVYIRRIEKNDRTRLPKDLLIESKRPIGPSWNKFGEVLKGVTGEEERLIMPDIIGVSLTDPSFARSISEFWFNITILVPSGDGVKLNVAVNEAGIPAAPLDYVKYKFAKKHLAVAPEEDLDANPAALFYIHDPATATEKRASQLDVRNKAKFKYLELIQDENKMDSVLSVLSTYKNPVLLSKDEKILLLEDISAKKPVEFITTVEDTKLQAKSFIYRAINAGIFKESGSRIIYDDTILGEDLDSAVAFLKSKEGSRVYVSAEGKLSQWALTK